MQSDAPICSNAEPPENEISYGQNSLQWKHEHNSNFGKSKETWALPIPLFCLFFTESDSWCYLCAFSPLEFRISLNVLKISQLATAPQQRGKLLVCVACSWDLLHLFCEHQGDWNGLGYIHSQKVNLGILSPFSHVSIQAGTQGLGNSGHSSEALSNKNKFQQINSLLYIWDITQI